MCNKEQLIGYVYGELSAADATAFEAHVGECAECRGEIGQLRQARQHLAAWSPPEPEFNFHVVRTPARTPGRTRLAAIPQWALAAAAALLLVAGAASIANIEVRYGSDGDLIVRTGWLPVSVEIERASSEQVQLATAPQAVPTGAASEQVERQMAALLQRVSELEATQAGQGVRAAAAVRPVVSVPELRKILAESEARQRAETAVSIAQMWKDFNAARANDLLRVEQRLVKAQGRTNYQLLQQRDSIDSLRYLHSLSQQK